MEEKERTRVWEVQEPTAASESPIAGRLHVQAKV